MVLCLTNQNNIVKGGADADDWHTRLSSTRLVECDTKKVRVHLGSSQESFLTVEEPRYKYQSNEFLCFCLRLSV